MDTKLSTIFRRLRASFSREERPWFDAAVDVLLKLKPGACPDKDPWGVCADLKWIINGLMLAGGEEQIPDHRFSVDNIARSKTVLARLLPEIEKIRLEAFGSTRAPHRTIRAASLALREALRRDQDCFEASISDPAAWAGKVRELEARIIKLIAERNVLHPVRWFPGQDWMTLELFVASKKKKRGKPPGALSPWRTYPGTRLRRLAEDIKSLAAASSFSETGLLYFIAAGVPPLLVTAKIEFRGPVNTRDLLRAYKRLPDSAKRPRRLTVRNVDVHGFVLGLGGPPRTGIMEFWRTATAKWNRAHPDRRFVSRDGLKKAFERARKKLL